MTQKIKNCNIHSDEVMYSKNNYIWDTEDNQKLAGQNVLIYVEQLLSSFGFRSLFFLNYWLTQEPIFRNLI